MAEKRQQKRELHELRQEIAHSRDRLARDLGGLRYELDIPLKFRKSFQRNAGVWISAAVLTGVVFMARALPTKKIVHKPGKRFKGQEETKGLLQAGLAMGALRFAATVLRPVVVRFVVKKLGSYASRTGARHDW